MACQCGVTSVGFTPIPDMGAAETYEGHLGRLYEYGGTTSNILPAAHATALAAATAAIEKLDSAGNPSPSGKIVVLSTGMSNSKQKWAEFMTVVPDRNPAVVLVQGAKTARDAAAWASPASDVWTSITAALTGAGVTDDQVQVIWAEHAISGPTGDFATHLALLKGYLKAFVEECAARFPNLQIIFWSPRTYGGYGTTINPSPYDYETGYAVRDLLYDQYSGSDPDLAVGTVPAMAWATYMDGGQWKGAYWWADGTTANTQGTVWNCGDFETGDCIHPAGDHEGVFAPNGAEHKCAALLKLFFENSPYTTPWWYPPITPTIVGTIQSTTTGHTFTTAAAYTPPANEIQVVFVFSRAGASPNAPAVSGHGITYTLKDRQLFATIASPGAQIAVFEGAANAAPTNTVLTVTFGGQNQVACIVTAVSVSNIYALAQLPKKNATDSANSLQVDLDALTDEVFVIAGFSDIVGAAFTPKAGWTELNDLDTGGSPLGRLEIQYITPFDDPAEAVRSGVGNMAIGGLVLAYEGPPPRYLLEVIVSPTSAGTVVSSPAGINCESDCTEEYFDDTVVTLTATPAVGYVFVGWVGDTDTTNGNVATVTMDEAKGIEAVFRPLEPGDFGKRSQSGRNSRHWLVYLPTGLGPLDGFAPLRCGDLESARDNMRLLPGSIYGRDVAVTGRRQEIARVSDESQAGSLSLACTEEAAGGLDLLRAIGCPFPIQRRTCGPTAGGPLSGLPAGVSYANDLTTNYEHYSAVQLGERTLAKATAGGLNSEDDTPSVTFPGVYGRRFPLTDRRPASIDFGDEIPQGIVYCQNPLCSDCGLPCSRLYALTRHETIVPGVTEMVLYASEDGGGSWVEVAGIPDLGSVATAFIFCYQGSRLFIGGEDGLVYYSDDPEGAEWYEAAQLNNLLEPDGVWVTKMVSDGYAIFALVGESQSGVIRSTDAGLTWHYVIGLDSITTGQLRDIAVAGNVVATFGENGAGVAEIIYSYHFGDWQTWTSYTNAALPEKGAIGIANPNPFDADRAWFYLMGIDAGNDVQVWKTDDPEDWTLIDERLYDASPAWNFCQIALDGDGYIGWFQAIRADGATLTLRTSTGGHDFVDVSLPDTTNPGPQDTRQSVLAVCPADPDVAIVAYHSLEQEL